MTDPVISNMLDAVKVVRGERCMMKGRKSRIWKRERKEDRDRTSRRDGNVGTACVTFVGSWIRKWIDQQSLLTIPTRDNTAVLCRLDPRTDLRNGEIQNTQHERTESRQKECKYGVVRGISERKASEDPAGGTRFPPDRLCFEGVARRRTKEVGGKRAKSKSRRDQNEESVVPGGLNECRWRREGKGRRGRG